MLRLSIPRSVLALALMGAGTATAVADADMDPLIAQARSAAPASVSDNATIVVGGKVVVEGDNGWTCMPNTMPGDTAPVCIDAVWGEMMQAMGKKAPYKATKVGISYMLQGDTGGSGASNSDPFHPDPQSADDYVETGPHLMIIVPKNLLEGMTDDPSTGGPYVMWGDTDYAHIMVPVADKE
ncbi:MAG: hypothetical protein PVF89_03900 [Lysobacterales bacterium]